MQNRSVESASDEGNFDENKFRNDYKIESTAGDAIGSKFSAITLKYYEDPFLQVMFQTQARSLVKKSPIINRGYYTRVNVVETVVKKFLEVTNTFNKVQIVSLGAGFDTLAYRLLSSSPSAANGRLTYFEVDFPTIIDKKTAITMKKPILTKLVPAAASEPESKVPIAPLTQAQKYKNNMGYKFGSLILLPSDLRDTEALHSTLLNSGADPTVPTLILTECVLVYMQRAPAEALLSTMCSTFTSSVWVSYDMITPDDPFGRTMIQNLASAGHKVPGLLDYPSLDAQCGRYTTAGYELTKSCTMLQAYDGMISAADKGRLNTIEMLDEWEEWSLIMSHYSLSVAGKDSGSYIDVINCLPSR